MGNIWYYWFLWQIDGRLHERSYDLVIKPDGTVLGGNGDEH